MKEPLERDEDPLLQSIRKVEQTQLRQTMKFIGHLRSTSSPLEQSQLGLHDRHQTLETTPHNHELSIRQRLAGRSDRWEECDHEFRAR
jgi:hypothetical protein